MLNVQGMVIGGVVLAAVSFGAGMKVGADGEARQTEEKIETVKKASAKLIDEKLQEILTLQAEKAQALAEVAKVNATTMAQFQELQAILAADQVARTEASARVEAAAKDAARQARTAGERAQAAREVIQNVADQCARAGVPDDVVRMLNGILAPAP